MGSPFIVQDFGTPEQMQDGINNMLKQGYIMHSWRFCPPTYPTNLIGYGWFVVVFVQAPATEPKPTGIKCR